MEFAIHPIYHVSQLKRAIGDHVLVQRNPRVLDDFEWVITPAKVLAVRWNEVEAKWEALIAWHGQAECDAIWESVPRMQCQFSDFHLEDKVASKGGVLLGPRC